MSYTFCKYSGCGNDFILIDNRDSSFNNAHIPSLCNRFKGVGADGVILVEPSLQAAIRMRIYNADGSEAKMCGNGIRCFMHFLRTLGRNEPTTVIETGAGILTGHFEGDLVAIQMIQPTIHQLNLNLEGVTLHHLNTGVPHAVIFSETLESRPLGPTIRFHPHFAPEGTNVTFAKEIAPGRLRYCTFERGVEGETLACGTGATAAALAYALLYNIPSPITVLNKLDDPLTIRFTREGENFSQVVMIGAVTPVFRGTIHPNALHS